MYFADLFDNWEDQDLLKKQVMDQYKAYENFLKACCEIVHELNPSYIDKPEWDEIDVDIEHKNNEQEAIIGIHWYTNPCSSRDEYNHYAHFPISYLWEYGWLEKHKQKELEENLRRIKEHQIRVEEEKKQAEKKQYELFLKLKEKYEGTNNGNV